MNCKDCKHWNREAGLHEVFERANFGECCVITPGYIGDRFTGRPDIEATVAIKVWIGEATHISRLIVHADFGCVCFEKKRVRVRGREGGEREVQTD